MLAQANGTVLDSLLLQGGVLALLLLALGGSEFEVGLAFMLHNIAFMVRLVAAPQLDISRLKWVVYRWQVISCIAAGLMLVAYPFAMRWDPLVGRWAIIVMVGIYFIARQIGMAAWMPLMSQVVPMVLRGRVFGRMRVMLRMMGLLAIVLAGVILGQEPEPWRFIPVLGIGVITYGLRLYFLSRLPDPEAPREGEAESLWRVLRRPMTDGPFRQFVGVAFLVRMLPMLTMPFVVPFLVTELGVPKSYAVYATACGMVGAMSTLAMWGRMADRWGTRSVYTLSLISLACSAVVYAAAPSYETAPLLALALAMLGFMLHGAATGGVGLAETVRMMRQSPDEFRGSYMTLVYTAHGLAGAGASLAGGLLLANLPTEVVLWDDGVYLKRIYFVVAALAALVTIAALAWLTPIGEPRPRRRLEPLGELASLSFLSPVVAVVARSRRRVSNGKD